MLLTHNKKKLFIKVRKTLVTAIEYSVLYLRNDSQTRSDIVQAQ